MTEDRSQKTEDGLSGVALAKSERQETDGRGQMAEDRIGKPGNPEGTESLSR